MDGIFSDKNSPPLILDGATGSLLFTINHPGDMDIPNHDYSDSLWSSGYNFSNPYEVIKLHKEYISAGADIITTNTFRTNPAAIKKYDYSRSSDESVAKAVELAKISSLGSKTIIAGCNPPAEDCYQIKRTLSSHELSDNHLTHIELLIKNGCHFILNETQSHFDEIRIISEFCFANKIPYVISLFFNDNFRVLSGEYIIDVINYILNYSPLAVGFNCIKPSTFLTFIQRNEISDILKGINWGFHLNCGIGKFTDKYISCAIEPTDYAKIITNAVDLHPLYVGACCGSTPLHIKMIRRIFYEENNY